jgi:uncharacterized protein (PEP-CTERM system associated)
MTMASQRALAHRSPRVRTRWLMPLVACAASFSATNGLAQEQKTTLSVQTTVTATDNGNGAPKGFERDDLLISVRPGLQFSRRGSGLSVRADLEADIAASSRGTRPDRVLPRAHVDAQGELVERLLFLDASADVRQVESDPFGARVESGSARNTRTAGTYRLSPTLEYETSSGRSLLARYEAARTSYAGTTEGDVDTNAGVVRFALKPRPFGAALEWAAEDTDYADAAGTDLRIERLSATASVAIAGEWLLGISAGRERSEFASTAQTDGTYGLRMAWNPGPRTDVTAAVDRRFFGTGWTLNARHRTPRMSFSLRSLREPSNAGNGAAGGGLAGFLDAILTTRNPDGAQRGELVDSLIASRGLRNPILTASGATAGYAQLRTNNELTWVYLSTRTTVSLSAYVQQLRQLTRDDGTTFATGVAVEDSRQRGVSLAWNRQLAPQLSLGMAAQWSRIEGLGVREGEHTRDASLRANVARALSARTNLSLGLLVRRVSSNALSVSAFDETAGFAGLGHRF